MLALMIAICFLGFDRNEYPGDAMLPALHQHFAFTGYWLNNPPESKINSWTGKRQRLQDAGFGFLLLFNGRLERELQKNAALLGQRDAAAAIDAARREGFPAYAIIFVDQEEGGRMLPVQRAYLHAWVDAVNASGYRAGIYAPGEAARDIQANAGARAIAYWVAVDVCPPSKGCVGEARPPGESGIAFATVWQFAQSPGRRAEISACRNTYNKDGNCYGFSDLHVHLDLNSAMSADPSNGRI